MTDTRPSEPKELLELKVKKAATAPAPAPGMQGQSLADRARQPFATTAADNGGEGIGRSGSVSGAAEAAAVLTAEDEDEDGEEAEMPQEFEYLTDNEDGEE